MSTESLNQVKPQPEPSNNFLPINTITPNNILSTTTNTTPQIQPESTLIKKPEETTSSTPAWMLSMKKNSENLMASNNPFLPIVAETPRTQPSLNLMDLISKNKPSTTFSQPMDQPKPFSFMSAPTETQSAPNNLFQNFLNQNKTPNTALPTPFVSMNIPNNSFTDNIQKPPSSLFSGLGSWVPSAVNQEVQSAPTVNLFGGFLANQSIKPQGGNNLFGIGSLGLQGNAGNTMVNAMDIDSVMTTNNVVHANPFANLGSNASPINDFTTSSSGMFGTITSPDNFKANSFMGSSGGGEGFSGSGRKNPKKLRMY